MNLPISTWQEAILWFCTACLMSLGWGTGKWIVSKLLK